MVDAVILSRLVRIHAETAAPIVACQYGATLDVPALFSRPYFGQLSALRDDEGAKGIIARARQAAIGVPFPPAAIDIDTLDDCTRLGGP